MEYLTDAEFFKAKVDKLGIELMAGDFDCSTELLENVLNYAIDLGLIQSDNSILSCKSLDNRLEPLLSKRKRDRNEVIDDDNTQSKVKESKEKKSIVNESRTLAWFERQIDEIYLETLKLNNKDKDIPQAIKESYAHLAADSHRLAIIDQAGCKKLVNTWLSNTKHKNGTFKTGIRQAGAQILGGENYQEPL